MIIFCREGTSADSRAEPVRLGTRCMRRGIFDRGSFLGRFVSAPMMRCDAVKWLRAART